MKIRSVTLLVPLLLSLPCVAQAQQAVAVQRAPVEEPTADIDDVVVVQGWRHPVQLRLQMVNAELAVYDLFNQLTDDISLRLECSRRNVGGTRLQATDCAPRFEAQALAREGQDHFEAHREYLNAMAITSGAFSTVFPGAQNAQDAGGNADQFSSFIPAATAPPAFMEIRAGQARLKKEMDRIAVEHPEFMEAVTQYVDAKSRYTQALRREE